MIIKSEFGRKLWRVRYYDELYRIQEVTRLGHTEEEVRMNWKVSYPKIKIEEILL